MYGCGMSARVVLILMLSACAGPSAHQKPAAGSAQELTQAERVRAPVASTLTPNDPLAAPNCALQNTAACPELAPEPTQKEEPHHHHHGEADPAPAPSLSPLKSPTPGIIADTKVIDPVCKMKIDPKTAGGGSLWFQGRQHFFCSSSCRRTFISQNPGAK